MIGGTESQMPEYGEHTVGHLDELTDKMRTIIDVKNDAFINISVAKI
jgi:hypothetical protein